MERKSHSVSSNVKGLVADWVLSAALGALTLSVARMSMNEPIGERAVIIRSRYDYDTQPTERQILPSLQFLFLRLCFLAVIR